MEATTHAHASHVAKAEGEQGGGRCARWLPAHRWQLSLRTRKVLVWGHLLAINSLCLGE